MKKNPTRENNPFLSETPNKNLYLDEGIFELIKENVYRNNWLLTGDNWDFSQTGYFPYFLLENFLDEPLIFCKSEEGKKKILSNVCTHRGNLLLNDAVVAGSKLVCGYHGRSFSPEGELLKAPGFDKIVGFPRACDHLKAFPVMECGPFVFTTLGGDDKNFDLTKMISNRISGLKWDSLVPEPSLNRSFFVKANWILYVDNYLEGLHIPFVHKSLNQVLDLSDYPIELFDSAVLQVGYGKPGESVFDNETSMVDIGKPVAAYYWWIYPNIMINMYPWGISLNIVKPINLTLSKIEYRTYFWNKSIYNLGAGADLDRVEREDEMVIEQVQRGLKSSAYSRGVYSPKHENGIKHFHSLLLADLEK